MIPSKTYRKIVELVPILCVDVVLRYRGQYVLVRRKNEPLKGMWWVIGGRCLKNERVGKSAIRKVREETGLKISNLRLSGIYEDSYGKSAFGVPTHTMSVVFTADVVEYSPTIDIQSSDIKLGDSLPERFIKHYEIF
jgi:colanic acid biosynthesis protein WcaH